MAEETRDPNRYYDKLAVKEEESTWSRTAIRYVLSVLLFVFVVGAVLGTYWIWLDYGQGQPFSWESWRAHVEFRWNEFKKGHIDLSP